MGSRISRRRFLRATVGAATAMHLRPIGEPASEEFPFDERSTPLANDSGYARPERRIALAKFSARYCDDATTR
jgi:hypothetical protein